MTACVRAFTVVTILLQALASVTAWEYTPLKDMKMKTGEMITCRMTGWLFLSTHWMLASYDGNLIQVWPRGDKYYVEEVHYTSLINGYTGVDWNRYV